MVVNAFNPSIWEAEAGLCEFKDNLVYIESSRTAGAGSRETLSQKDQKIKK